MKNRFYLSQLLFLIITFLITGIFSGQKAFTQPPDEGATNFSVNNVQGDRFRVSWTRGSGERRIVVASEEEDFSGTGVPADGTDYNANNTFGTGDQIGSGNFVVYKGTGTNVTVNGLEHSTTYYFRIYEYNGTDFQTEYNITDVLSGSGTTLFPPSTGVSDLEFPEITGNSANLSWERGDGDRNILILREGEIPGEPTQYQQYFGNTTFGNGSTVGGGRAIVTGINNSANITNLEPNTWYYARFLEYNGTNHPVYNYGDALVDSFLTATNPTQGSEDYSISNVQGDRFRIGYTRGDGSRRLVVMRQDEPVEWTPVDGQDYNANSSFGQGDDLGNNTFVVGRTTSTNLTVSSLTPSTTYYFAIFEFNGQGTNTYYLTETEHVLTGSGQTLSAPTEQGGNFEFTEITGNSAAVSFDAGNGDGRIVLARAGAPVEDVPVNLTTYWPNSNFNNASSIGESKILYRGNGTSFDLTGLQPEVEYHFAVFEYNGNNGPVYNQNNPGRGSFTTVGAPTVPTSDLTYSNIQGDRIRLNFVRGDGAGRIIIARQGEPVNAFPVNGQTYSASTTFGNGEELGEGNFVINNTTGTNTTVSSLTEETMYYFAIIEYNGDGENRLYMPADSALTGNQATLFRPEQQATELEFSEITPNSVTISWTNGDGDGRIVLIRPDAPVEDLPVNLTSYWPNSNYPNASSIGTSRIVYRGSDTIVNVTNVPPGEYHIAVIEFNGSSGPVYRNDDPLRGEVVVGGPPVTPASNISFNNIQGDRFRTSFTRGDGTSRLIIMKEGSPVDAWPTDGNSYASNSTFGNGHELGEGNFVVYSGTGSNSTTSGLSPETTYYVAIVEFNGSGATSFYQHPDTVATGSNSTLFPPEVPTSNFFANNVTGNRMQLTWTNGSGSGRIIIGRRGQPVNQYPEDLSSPWPNSTFGNGTHLGDGNYVLYAGTGDNFTVTGLEPDTTYHFAFMEYNGSSGRVYLRDTIARAAFQTEERPFVAASNLSVSNRNGDRLRVNFTAGNGARRLIVFKKDGFVDAIPQDLVNYNAAAFGEGTELGDGNFVVGKVGGGNVNVTGLEPDTNYGVAVFEFDGSDGNERYMINEYLTGFVRTAWPPDTPPTGLIVSNVGTSSANITWTNGTGERRMVVMRPFQPVTFIPEVLNGHGSTSSNFNSNFNFLDDDHRHVYRGNNDNVSLTNMEPGTTYHIAIYEYNGNNQPVYNEVPLTGFFTTLPEEGIAIGGFDAIMFCPSQVFAIPYFFAGTLESDNEISAELSDINGDFSEPILLGVQSTTNAQGSVSVSLPADLPQGSGYRFRVLSSNPAEVSADNGADLTIADTPVPEIVIEGDVEQTCNEPVTLTVSQPGYLIQWYLDGEPIPFATGNTWVAEVSGSYQVGISGAFGGCAILSEPVVLSIAQTPDFEIPLHDVYCVDDAPVSLEETLPQGGTYSGPGIVDGQFDPALAGIGQHLMTYTWIDEETECSFEKVFNILVVPLPEVTLELPFDTINQLDDPVLLDMGQPLGGTYYFGFDQEPITSIIPSELEPGEYTLFYERMDEFCLGVDSAVFIVTEAPQVVVAPELGDYCANLGEVILPEGTPEGGTWSGQFVSDGVFDVQQAEEGEFWLTYTVELTSGFFQSDSVIANVLPASVTELTVILCADAVYELNGQTFDETGIYEINLGENVHGCDSILLLDLTIGQPDLVITQDITVFLDEQGEATIEASDLYNGILENWDIALMELDQDSFTCADIGEHVVSLVITDENGNQACGEATVTVVDNLAPVVMVQDITAELDENGQVTVSADDIDNGSTDNCGIENMVLSQTEFSCEDVGEHEVTLTVTDVNGNEASATAMVTVVDNMAPVVLVQDITVELDENGQAIISAEDIDNGSTDNCGIESMVLSQTEFSCEDVGEIEVTLTVTDVNGNEAVAIAMVTVADNMAPVVLVQDITVELDENGQATIFADDVDNGSTDNCGIESMVLSQTEFSCEDVGEHEVTFTVTDVNGNEASATATITIVDNMPPVVLTQDITLELDENNEASIVPSDIDNGSSDNCGIESWSLDMDTFTLEHVGENTVTLTVTDIHGNSASETAVVTVVESAPQTFDLVIEINPSEAAGSVTGEGEYEADAEVALSATPAEGYEFINWTDEDGLVLSTSAEFMFTMPAEDVFLVANFEIASSIADVHQAALRIFPNPATSHLNIQTSAPVTSITVNNINGTIVYHQEQIHNREYTLDIHSLEPGVYIIRIVKDERVYTRKFQVVR